jgi:hypothetical protein
MIISLEKNKRMINSLEKKTKESEILFVYSNPKFF